MNNNLFSSWIARARGEEHPSPNVAAHVMHTLAAPAEPEEANDWLPGWRFEVALVSITLAIIFLGAQSLREVADPWREYVSMFMAW